MATPLPDRGAFDSEPLPLAPVDNAGERGAGPAFDSPPADRPRPETARSSSTGPRTAWAQPAQPGSRASRLTAGAPSSQGLGELVRWWREQQPAPAPAASAPGSATPAASTRPAPPEAQESEPLARSVERLLLAELRRHGIELESR